MSEPTTTPRLGPQAELLLAAVPIAEKGLWGDGEEAMRYAAALEMDWPTWRDTVEAAESRIERALEADGIDSVDCYDLGSCVWGLSALALAARHLIGSTVEWADYVTLTRPWALAFGKPMHPEDVLADIVGES